MPIIQPVKSVGRGYKRQPVALVLDPGPLVEHETAGSRSIRRRRAWAEGCWFRCKLAAYPT